ncbi:hypothetical protein M404DRAFT_1008403 [Pisolithus tinctorius Marx 270]|uniref:Uncharacterized protein n=1 Tax=Pisolithus tinctorius Marx 270 TaxID=870435 RepID=A0A0C3MZS4_PISTI|nr:hypothetical protein M404DRAFT_1009159 [Pisolithus tinctorius Marx 270]KIN94339.1 hypothetical protein M404DRAFT_1008403 [Pisolithus tinctorius Marx 270]
MSDAVEVSSCHRIKIARLRPVSPYSAKQPHPRHSFPSLPHKPPYPQMAPVTTTPLVPSSKVHVKLLMGRSDLLPRFPGEQWKQAIATMISGPT